MEGYPWLLPKFEVSLNYTRDCLSKKKSKKLRKRYHSTVRLADTQELSDQVFKKLRKMNLTVF